MRLVQVLAHLAALWCCQRLLALLMQMELLSAFLAVVASRMAERL